MSYTVKLANIESARVECITYMGKAKYQKFVRTVAGYIQGQRITNQYRRVAFSCGMVGMRGYLITRAVFLDARKYIDDQNEAAPN